MARSHPLGMTIGFGVVAAVMVIRIPCGGPGALGAPVDPRSGAPMSSAAPNTAQVAGPTGEPGGPAGGDSHIAILMTWGRVTGAPARRFVDRVRRARFSARTRRESRGGLNSATFS